jgi:CRISPR-associated protein Cas1
MKKLLNTLYVTTEGAALRKDGENLVVSIEDAEHGRLPFHMLASVVAFGSVYLSPGLMQACCAAGITMVLLDRSGRFQARIDGPVAGNVLLRRAQYRASEEPDEIVRSIVSGKIANQRAVLMRANRDHGSDMQPEHRDAVAKAAERLAQIVRRTV